MKGVTLVMLLASLTALVAVAANESESSSIHLKSGTGLYPRQDTVGRPGGPGPSLFGWMGSQLSRLPMLLFSRPPRPRQYGNRPPPHFQSQVVMPDPPGGAEGAGAPPSQNEDDGGTFDDDSQEPNEVDIGSQAQTQTLQFPHHAQESNPSQNPSPQFYQQPLQSHNPSPQLYPQAPQQVQQQQQSVGQQLNNAAAVYSQQYQQQQQLQQQHYQQQLRQHQQERVPQQLEVVKSQMISYNHHQQPYNLPPPTPANNNVLPSLPPPHYQPLTYTATAPSYQNQNQNQIPHSEPMKSHFKPSTIPVAPQSTGPDYFDTAYNSQQQRGHHHSTSNGHQQNRHQQAAPVSGLKNNNAENNFGATFLDIHQGQPQFGAVNGPPVYPAAALPIGQQDPGSPFSSIIENTHDLILNSAASSISNVISPQPQQQSQQLLSTQQPQQPQQSGSKQEPSVQIVSQGTKDGNPVFEVVADADAPLFDGQHPFDINKLIEMIEPGAVVDQPPQLSQASSETRDVVQSSAGFPFGRRR